MPLYGNELGPDVTPFEAGLGKVVRLDKPGDFVGRTALAKLAAAGGPAPGRGRTLVGLRRPVTPGSPAWVPGDVG